MRTPNVKRIFERLETMTIGYGGLKKGMPIELDGEPYVVVDYERSKKEQRAPVARIRFKSLRNGKVLDKSFNGFDVKFTPAEIERREAQFLYGDGEQFYFMDEVNYEQYMLSATLIEFAMPFLIDQLKVDLIFYKDDVISIELPNTVDLVVSESEPGYKGDTAQGATKNAILETGLNVQVPLFIDIGDKIKVDTRTKEYLSRV